jgi:hypothetical protein
MRQRSTTGRMIIPNFKLYYRVKVRTRAWYWQKQKNRHEYQWNIRCWNKPTQLLPSDFLTKVQGEKITFSTNGAGKTGFPTAEDWNYIPAFHLYTISNQKWIKDLHVWSETMKLVQEEIGNTLDHIGISSNFMNGTSIANQEKILANGTTWN